MKRLALIALSLLATGCTHIHHVGSSEQDPRRAQLNTAAASKPVVVELLDGTRHPARDLLVTADSASWTDPLTFVSTSAPISDVVSVQLTRRNMPAVKGLILGTILGGLLGFSVGMFVFEDDWLFSAEEQAVMLALPGALGGAVAGVVMESTSKHVYRFARPPLPERRREAGQGAR